MCKRPPSHNMSKCPPLVDCPMRVSPVPSPLRPFLSLVESVNRGGLSLVLTLPGKLCSPSLCSASTPPLPRIPGLVWPMSRVSRVFYTEAGGWWPGGVYMEPPVSPLLRSSPRSHICDSNWQWELRYSRHSGTRLRVY